MKHFVLIFITALTFSSYGQTNPLPVDSTLRWNGRVITFCGWGCAYMGYVSYFADSVGSLNDTIIGSHTYRKLVSDGSWSESYLCAFRSDTAEKAVYAVLPDSTSEVLYFDFDESYQINDTVTTCMGGNYSGIYQATIYGIDSVNVDGQWFKKYGLSMIGSSLSMHVSERLLNSFAFPFYPDHDFETMWELKCFLENDSHTFGSWCPFSEQEYGTTTGLLNHTNKELELYPNPVQDVLYIRYELDKPSEIKVYNSSGLLVFIEKIHGETSIDMSSYDSGLYLYTIQTEKESFQGKFIKQ